jgi:uncharacterized protein (DUF1778 family)
MSDDTYTDTAETTTLGIRIPEDLRAKIREAAKLEERTESGFARYYLNKAADAALAQLEAKPEA